jgi:hypothetical protein
MSNNENLFLLNNSENYLLNLDNNITEILLHHLKIINMFIHNIAENNITNSNNKLLIIIKGIESLLHIYNFLLYYTKNSHLSFYHTQKAIYMYIEFIKQITDEQNNLLNLKINDAVVFIYKKTIFDVKKEFMKNKENNIIELLNINSTIIKYIFSFIYNKNSNDIIIYLKQVINLLDNIYLLHFNEKNNISVIYFSNLSFFVEILYSHFLQTYTIEQYINCLEIFSKKINKTNITTKYMKEIIYFDNKTTTTNLTPNELINLFF